VGTVVLYRVRARYASAQGRVYREAIRGKEFLWVGMCRSRGCGSCRAAATSLLVELCIDGQMWRRGRI
jgi:hypothetical protein